jgi:hypothetical protein
MKHSVIGRKCFIAITSLLIESQHGHYFHDQGHPYSAQQTNSRSLSLAFESECKHKLDSQKAFGIDSQGLEICGIICKDLPALIARLHALLERRVDAGPQVIQTRCLNHMINLVFLSLILTDAFANARTQLPGVIGALNSPSGLELVHRTRPALLRTRSVSPVDVLGFLPTDF